MFLFCCQVFPSLFGDDKVIGIRSIVGRFFSNHCVVSHNSLAARKQGVHQANVWIICLTAIFVIADCAQKAPSVDADVLSTADVSSCDKTKTAAYEKA